MAENIDAKFYEAMRPIGGRRPVEIDARAGKALNADIVFRDEEVILEVKTLMEDPSEHEDHIHKVSEVYRRWMGRPGVPLIWGQRMINSADVPHEMAFELARTLADPIQTAVTKANRQIREAKSSLQMPNAHGVLVLCNSGATTMTPHVVLHALHHALAKRHRSISSTIFMTHGVPVYLPGVPEPAEIFAAANRFGHEALPEEFVMKIQEAWMRFQARTQQIRVYAGVDGNELFGATNASTARAQRASAKRESQAADPAPVLQSHDYTSMNVSL